MTKPRVNPGNTEARVFMPKSCETCPQLQAHLVGIAALGRSLEGNDQRIGVCTGKPEGNRIGLALDAIRQRRIESFIAALASGDSCGMQVGVLGSANGDSLKSTADNAMLKPRLARALFK